MRWPSNNYETLFDIWQQWVSSTDGNNSHWPILDRWLKKYLRSAVSRTIQPAKFTRAKNQTGAVELDLSAQLAISSAMFTAMRFLQLACALEHSYRAQAPLDWEDWDKSWQQFSVQKIPPAAFWYWIALRADEDNLPPRILRDADARKAWFMQVKAEICGPADSQLTGVDLLWQGLRPQWLASLRERAQASNWSDQSLRNFVELQNQPPPLWLRPQRGTPLADLQQRLSREGVIIELIDQQFLCAKGGAGVNHTETYRQGLVEIQDLSSQRIAQTVAVKPGDKVWDACAGAGGKSLAIAARMHNKGVILATDLHTYKLDELKRRAKRAEIFNIRTFEWQGKEPLRLPQEIARQQGFDWVLIDAPCSSAGTWRRNPDARWRFDEKDTAELIQLQRQILHNASAAVRKNGHLVYATCSWQVSENESQVNQFLADHPDFCLSSQETLGTPDQDADTMYVAVLTRSNPSALAG